MTLSAKKVVRRYTKHSLEHALALASHGVHVFPLGLRPLHKTEHGWKLDKVYYKGIKWGTEATTSRKQIKRWWAEYPDSVVGINTGMSGISVVDRDNLDVDLGPTDTHLPDTFDYPTARGGRHHLYRTPKGVKIRSGELLGVDGSKPADTDIKAWGGMVVYYGGALTDETAALLDSLPELPEPWRVLQGTGARSRTGDEGTQAADVDEWIDARRDGTPSHDLQALAEQVPSEGIDNNEALHYLGPLVRAAWDAPGGGKAVRRGIERYSGGYGTDAERDAYRAIGNAIADEEADRAKYRLTRVFDLNPAPRVKRKKAKRKSKSAPKKHDEYTPRGTIAESHHPSRPLDVATDILAEEILPPVLYWRGSWHIYDLNHWRLSSSEELENLLYAALANTHWMKYGTDGPKPQPWSPSSSRVREVLRAIQSQRTLAPETIAPEWLDASGRSAGLVPARDCLLDPKTNKAYPRSASFFSTNFVDADVAAKHSKPKAWLTFLHELWPDDAESIALLQEWFGYLVAGDTRRHKGMLLIGPKRSGKGTLLHMGEALVGGAQGAFAATMSSFSEPFGMEQAEGRSLLTMGDLRGSGREAASAAQKLLEIIGGDSVYVNRKGRAAISTVLRTRVMVATNTMPKLYDDAGVIESRFLVLRMTESFAGREDLDLLDRLLPELGGIVQWALEGYRRLEKAGAFSVPASDAEDRAELRANSAPIVEFLEDACVPTKELGATRIDMWTAYQTWCGASGAPQMEPAQFASAMAGAGHPAHRPRDGQSVRGAWRYRGVALREVETAQERAARLWPSAEQGFITKIT